MSGHAANNEAPPADDDGFLASVHQQVLNSLGKDPRTAGGYETFYDAVMGFVSAVDWERDTWIAGILMAELFVLILVLFTRRIWSAQLFIFFFNAFVIFSCERINTYAQGHWREFSTQDYFDNNGVFVGVIVCAPILFTMAVQMLMSLYDTSHLLVDVKRKELKEHLKKKHKESQATKKDK